MEFWSIALFSLSVVLLLKAFNGFSSVSRPTLPPGLLSFPLIGNIQLLTTSCYDLEDFLRSLHSKFGPLVTLTCGPKKMIFINDRLLAHEALITRGEVFANRPAPSTVESIISCKQHNINTSFYGPNWRLLRRNLTSGIRHMSDESTRYTVLQTLIQQITRSAGPLKIVDHFSGAFFFALAMTCFGEGIDYQQAMELQRRNDAVASKVYDYPLFDFFPKLARILLRRQWDGFQKLVRDNEEMILEFINSRRYLSEENLMSRSEKLAYVDTLFSLDLPEEKRKLNDGELVSLCYEFLLAGGDPLVITFQWIFANLVNNNAIQEKLYAEIEEVMGRDGLVETVIEQEKLGRMKYLKAVVLEPLRRHPPAHFLLPHGVDEDMVFAGYLLPKDGTVNFMVAEMGRDPKVWDDPMAFRPERFVESGEELDITGTKEIKMMPFGVGRRMCPGYAFAMQQLEYFVANLVWRFQWKAVDGVGVDLSEDRQFSVAMKNPLQVCCVARK